MARHLAPVSPRFVRAQPGPLIPRNWPPVSPRLTWCRLRGGKAAASGLSYQPSAPPLSAPAPRSTRPATSDSRRSSVAQQMTIGIGTGNAIKSSSLTFRNPCCTASADSEKLAKPSPMKIASEEEVEIGRIDLTIINPEAREDAVGYGGLHIIEKASNIAFGEGFRRTLVISE